MLDKIIVDADLCIKLGGHNKYHFLYEVLPLLAKEIYIHNTAYNEVMMPPSAVFQINRLLAENKVHLVDETNLGDKERAVYDATYQKLARVMMNPRKPNKNKGEVSSLAYAKVAIIPIFVTDEMNLQPIIDVLLNTGTDDITCIRIVDIVKMARDGELEIPRKVAKAMWMVAGKKKEVFDLEIWPIIEE